MGWRRVKVTFWKRLSHGKRAGFAAFGALSSAGIGVAGLLGWTTKLPVVVAGAGGVVLLSTCVAWLRGRMKLVADAVVDEMCEEPGYTAGYCTPAHLQEACEMTKPYYGEEYVAGDVAEQWRAKNPEGFVEILDSAGELCACFGLLGLSESFRSQFYAGNVTDTRLRAQDVLDLARAKRCAHLYISGIVVRDPETVRGKKCARVMLWVLLQYYRTHYGFRKKRTLYGLGVTRESERLMTRGFEFTLRSGGTGRLDRYNLYDIEVTKGAWEGMLGKVGDLGGMCSLAWQGEVAGEGGSSVSG